MFVVADYTAMIQIQSNWTVNGCGDGINAPRFGKAVLWALLKTAPRRSETSGALGLLWILQRRTTWDAGSCVMTGRTWPCVSEIIR